MHPSLLLLIGERFHDNISRRRVSTTNRYPQYYQGVIYHFRPDVQSTISLDVVKSFLKVVVIHSSLGCCALHEIFAAFLWKSSSAIRASISLLTSTRQAVTCRA